MKEKFNFRSNNIEEILGLINIVVATEEVEIEVQKTLTAKKKKKKKNKKKK